MHEITTLPNGLRVVTHTMAETESVTVNFFVGAGGRYEDMKSEYGVTHFLEHLLFKGTRKRPTAQIISEEIDSVGGYMNAYTTEDHTSYYIKVPKVYFGLAFNILADIINDPLLEQIEIDKERKVVIEEMKVFEDDPARYIYDLVGELLWPHDALRTNVIGTEHIISAMQRSTIVEYFAQLYAMDNVVISVAGNVTHQSVVELAEQLLSGAQLSSTRTWQPAVGNIASHKIKHEKQDTSQTHMILAGRAPRADAVDEVPMKLLSTILGSGSISSRLFLNIRENKGLAYTIYMSYSTFVDTGKFEIYAGINNESVPQAIAAILEELQKIQQELVSIHELNKAKEQLKGRYIMSQEGNAAVADMQGSQLLLSGKVDSLAHTISKIEEVTSQDILDAARAYLYKDSVRLALIGPQTDEQIQNYTKLMEK